MWCTGQRSRRSASCPVISSGVEPKGSKWAFNGGLLETFSRDGRSQYAAVPPSTEIIAPLMPDPASEAKSTATTATSSTVLTRLLADSAAYCSRNCSVVIPAERAATSACSVTKSVTTSPGHSALTVIPSGPTSLDRPLVNPLSACLAVTYCTMKGLPCLPSTEEMLMIRPDFCASIDPNALREA